MVLACGSVTIYTQREHWLNVRVALCTHPPLPSGGHASDITETNYINIGYVVAVLIGSSAIPVLCISFFFFFFWKLDITFAARDWPSFPPEHMLSAPALKEQWVEDVLSYEEMECPSGTND
jgi:hypothetical protein